MEGPCPLCESYLPCAQTVLIEEPQPTGSCFCPTAVVGNEVERVAGAIFWKCSCWTPEAVKLLRPALSPPKTTGDPWNWCKICEQIHFIRCRQEFRRKLNCPPPLPGSFRSFRSFRCPIILQWQLVRQQSSSTAQLVYRCAAVFCF